MQEKGFKKLCELCSYSAFCGKQNLRFALEFSSIFTTNTHSMKPLIILILVFSAFNVSAKKKLTVEELKDLKSRPLLVVLVPEEDPRAYQKHAGKPTFNDALKKAPEAWKSNSEIKVIDSKEWDKMTVADKKKWTVLTLAGMDAHFMQYRLPMTGKNIEDNIMYECLFYITLNRADNEKYKLRGSANCDYEIPLQFINIK